MQDKGMDVEDCFLNQQATSEVKSTFPLLPKYLSSHNVSVTAFMAC